MPDSFWIWYCVPSAKWHITLKAEGLRFSRQSLCAMESRWSNTVKIFYTNYFFKCICLSSVSLADVVNLCSVGWKKKKKGIPTKVSTNRVWLCDCVVWIKDMSVKNLSVVSLYSIRVLSCLVSILFILFESLQCTKCKFLLYTCVVRYTFSTNISVRLFCFINKSLVHHFCCLYTWGPTGISLIITFTHL